MERNWRTSGQRSWCRIVIPVSGYIHIVLIHLVQHDHWWQLLHVLLRRVAVAAMLKNAFLTSILISFVLYMRTVDIQEGGQNDQHIQQLSGSSNSSHLYVAPSAWSVRLSVAISVGVNLLKDPLFPFSLDNVDVALFRNSGCGEPSLSFSESWNFPDVNFVKYFCTSYANSSHKMLLRGLYFGLCRSSLNPATVKLLPSLFFLRSTCF